jgi:FkbH-like protein
MQTTTDQRALMTEIGRLMAVPNAAACAQVARTIDGFASGVLPWPETRVAFVASFTIDPVAPIVTAFGAASGLVVRTYAAGGDQWPQEAIDPSSGLRAFHPDVIVVALALEDIAPSLTDGYLGLDDEAVQTAIAQAISRVGEFVASLRRWSTAKILLHGFPPPVEPSLGILDGLGRRGQADAIRAIDRGVREQVLSLPDVYVVDIERVIARVGYSHMHDARLWTLARVPFTAVGMQALAQEHLRYLRAFCGRARKVLAVDLDGTLWGGIVGEDGAAGIRLGDGARGRAFVELQRVLRELTRRGVLLVINSTNNVDDAREVLERHPAMLLRPEDFAATRINWQDKATNLVELSDELGLALDSFVYVDDNAAECERIRQALPEVMTVHLAGDPATYAGTIKSLGVFDTLAMSEEDRARTVMYRDESRRRETRQAMASLEEYYASLDTELEIQPIDAVTLARAAELTQRTNQFNLTTRRFTADDLRSFLAQPEREGFVFRLRDRFGDYGIIGVALTERRDETMAIDTLLLSCRVLKRTVEDSVLSFLCARARRAGASVVEGRFRPSPKNAVAATLYESHGFSRADDAADTMRFTRPAAEALPPSPWIRMSQRGEAA